MTYSTNLQVSSVAIVTHTAIYDIHEAPCVPLNYFYDPDNKMEVTSCKVIWVNYNEPTQVILFGTDISGKPTEKPYGIRQAPTWVFKLLQHNLGDMGWKILKEKDANDI